MEESRSQVQPGTTWKNWLWLVVLLLVLCAVNAAVLTLIQVARAAPSDGGPTTDGAFGYSAKEWSTAFGYAWPRAALGLTFAVMGIAGLVLIRRRSARAAAGSP